MTTLHDRQGTGDRAVGIDPKRALPIGERIDGHLAGLDRMIRLTALSDTKAAPIVAVNATIAAVSVTQVGNLQNLLKDAQTVQVVSVWALVAVYLLFASISVVTAVRIFLPRDKPGRRSVLYFADVARMPLEEFIVSSTMQTAEDLERDALEQQHAVALVVAGKFERVRLAFITMLAAIAAWIGIVALANI
jgi:Pycsar effector protein